MVSAATETAVSASISMPVWAAILAEAVMTMRLRSGGMVKFTSQWVIGRGWQRGMRSPVFLAAMIPASRAVARTFPLEISLRSMRSRVADWRWISPPATASRSWIGLAETSTMEASPLVSRWVRRGSAPDGLEFIVPPEIKWNDEQHDRDKSNDTCRTPRERLTGEHHHAPNQS